MGTAVFHKSTGEPIEFQSSPRPGTCIENAIAVGFRRDDLEEREISLEEFFALIPKTQNPPRLSIDDLADLLVERGILAKADIDGKKR